VLELAAHASIVHARVIFSDITPFTAYYGQLPLTTIFTSHSFTSKSSLIRLTRQSSIASHHHERREPKFTLDADVRPELLDDAYGRSSLPNQDGYGRSSVNDESSRGYGDAEYGSGGIQQGYSTSGHGGGDGHGGQAGGANFTTSGPTAKRGSKACVACEYNRRLFLRHAEGRARSKRKESVSRRPFRFEPVVPEMPDERYSMRLREGDGEDRTGEKWERWR